MARDEPVHIGLQKRREESMACLVFTQGHNTLSRILVAGSCTSAISTSSFEISAFVRFVLASRRVRVVSSTLA